MRITRKLFVKELQSNSHFNIQWFYTMSHEDLLLSLIETSVLWDREQNPKKKKIIIDADRFCYHAILARLDQQSQPFKRGDNLQPIDGPVPVNGKRLSVTASKVHVEGVHKVKIVNYNKRGEWLVGFQDYGTSNGRLWCFKADKFRKVRKPRKKLK